MARLQVLYLPSTQVSGDRSEPRFGLVLDQVGEPLSDQEKTELADFAAQVGAAGTYTTARTVDLAQDVGDEDMEAFAAELRQMVDRRLAEHVAAAEAAGPKRPDVSTAEGRAAMVWTGGRQ